MGIINDYGENISYECSDLINEVKKDLLEFGFNTEVIVWCKNIDGAMIITNYAFNSDEYPVSNEELDTGETFKPMKLKELYDYLVKQNNII